MQLTVGQAVTLKGRRYICEFIERMEREQLMQEDAQTYQLAFMQTQNSIYLNKTVEDFDAGDVVAVKYERAGLVAPGQDFLLVYSSYTARRARGTSSTEGTEEARQAVPVPTKHDK